MRYSRLFLRAQGSYFHVVTRVVGRAFILGAGEKRVLHAIMRRLEKYSGVQVLTYCLMDNHLHLLLHTEEIDGDAIGDEELIRRIRGMYTERLGRELKWQLDTWRKKKNRKQIRFLREKYLQRLGNLSEFMWALKNRFAKWYNMENDRCGTLWEDRYKVVLVEDSEAVLVKIAAYIDLNPVRAGLVEDPADYGWSGYGEACGTNGNRGGGGRQAEARRGIGRIVGAQPGRGWRDAGRAYQQVLNCEKRDSAELLRRRVSSFSDGVIVGSREFVDRVYSAQPERKRKTGAKPMRNWPAGAAEGLHDGLFVVQDLAREMIVKAWYRDL